MTKSPILNVSPIGVAFLKKDKSFVRGIFSGLVQRKGDRKITLSPIGVASVRGIEEGLVPLQGDKYSKFSPIGVAFLKKDKSFVRGIFSGLVQRKGDK